MSIIRRDQGLLGVRVCVLGGKQYFRFGLFVARVLQATQEVEK
jgi:hypothetical protein